MLSGRGKGMEMNFGYHHIRMFYHHIRKKVCHFVGNGEYKSVFVLKFLGALM